MASDTIKTSYAAGRVFVNTLVLRYESDIGAINIENVINRVDLIGTRDSTHINMIGGLLSETLHATGVLIAEISLVIESFTNYGNITRNMVKMKANWLDES
jgi:hypothetical protein